MGLDARRRLRAVFRATSWGIALVLGLGGTARADRVALPEQPPGVPWPTARWTEGPLPAGVDEPALAGAVDALFAAQGPSGVPNTRALLLVHDGRLVLERYADGFGRDSRFLSWSMAKTVTQAAVGVLVGEGRLALDAPAPIPAWSGADDPRRDITLRHMLQMTTGLANADRAGNGDISLSFVARMLFAEGSRDVVAFAADAPSEHPAGSHWAYSTATSMLLAHLVSEAVGGGREATLAFLRRALFDRIGMASAVPEFDAAGNFLGGGFVWARARDWARFGLLYLRDGVWEGERVLPEGWVDLARAPGDAENSGVYGGHVWLSGDASEGQPDEVPDAAPTAFAALGNGGQYVLVDPARNLVLVRLGELHGQTWPELTGRVGAALAAFPSGDAP